MIQSGTLQNKQINRKNSFSIKDLNNLKLNEDPEKKPDLSNTSDLLISRSPDLSNNSTESQLLDFPDVSQIKEAERIRISATTTTTRK